jgi:uncharacterized membrane protein YeiH
MMLCGSLTASGGGILCDLLLGRAPEIFHGDPAIVPALLTRLGAWVLRGHLSGPLVVLLLVTAGVAIRLITLPVYGNCGLRTGGSVISGRRMPSRSPRTTRSGIARRCGCLS